MIGSMAASVGSVVVHTSARALLNTQESDTLPAKRHAPTFPQAGQRPLLPSITPCFSWVYPNLAEVGTRDIAWKRSGKDKTTGKGHASPSHTRGLARLGDWPTALDKTNYDHDHRNDEEEMDEASERVGGDHP